MLEKLAQAEKVLSTSPAGEIECICMDSQSLSCPKHNPDIENKDASDDELIPATPAVSKPRRFVRKREQLGKPGEVENRELLANPTDDGPQASLEILADTSTLGFYEKKVDIDPSDTNIAELEMFKRNSKGFVFKNGVWRHSN